MDFESLFREYNDTALTGHYIALKHIESRVKSFDKIGTVEVIGYSLQKKPLYLCRAGSGKTQLLMWSQMHGNESTTTKAVFDFLNVLKSGSDIAKTLLNAFTFHIIPMLNPDGAEMYTRENANAIDLNRDFCNLSQPESIALFEYFKKIKPDYCFNLHDQRTIYGAGDSGKPATVSFLSPSFNEPRDISHSREKAMAIIVAMNETLQKYIPGQVGRFDDSFNINCVGDTFQFYEVPTVLFEAGHYPDDYAREMTRKYIFMALMSGLEYIHENVVVNNVIQYYLNIPQNKINFFDFVYKNVKINCDGIEKITNFGAQFSEVFTGDKINFEARIAETEIPSDVFGHEVFDAQGETYRDDAHNKPELDQNANFFIGNTKFINGKKV
jgi:hypothetical protein